MRRLLYQGAAKMNKENKTLDESYEKFQNKIDAKFLKTVKPHQPVTIKDVKPLFKTYEEMIRHYQKLHDDLAAKMLENLKKETKKEEK